MTFRPDDLAAFAKQLLTRAGAADAKATLVAESLVASNLRAVDSHGLQLLPYYLDQIRAGNMKPAEDGHVASESGACMVYDGAFGVGQAIAAVCCDHAIRMARATGIAIVVARDSNHYGAAAFWASRMSASGMIGITMCNASPLVAPWQGKDPRFGTNPISMSVPGADTWLLDMATTTVALGKILNWSFAGREEIPAGWAMDAEGVPITDTATALQGLLMPLGGYKGSGLAMLAEILCAVLGGGAMSLELGGIRDQSKPMRTSQVFIAIDVARFMPLHVFEDRMQALVKMTKSSRPASGFDEVLVAGEPEWRAQQQRLRDGIPLSSGVWENLKQAAERLGVAMPENWYK